MPFAGIRHSANSHRTVFHRILARQGCINTRALARWTHSIFRAYGVPTQAFFQQRLLDRTTYALRCYPAFNQWSPCSVSLHSDPVVSCKHLYIGPVGAQRLSRLGYCLRNSLLLVAGSNGLCPSLVSGIQPMVTVQCFTAFCPGSVV